MSTKYEQVVDNEWTDFPSRMQCCDCGLVHDLELRVIGARRKHGKLTAILKANRNNRATAQVRRHKHAKTKKGKKVL